jgi:hypothetical protein
VCDGGSRVQKPIRQPPVSTNSEFSVGKTLDKPVDPPQFGIHNFRNTPLDVDQLGPVFE